MQPSKILILDTHRKIRAEREAAKAPDEMTGWGGPDTVPTAREYAMAEARRVGRLYLWAALAVVSLGGLAVWAILR